MCPGTPKWNLAQLRMQSHDELHYPKLLHASLFELYMEGGLELRFATLVACSVIGALSLRPATLTLQSLKLIVYTQRV
jgi:hypothetical protein